jgi:8-oxo-dGTP diphosphatase
MKIERVILASDALIIKDGKILLVKRKWPPFKGGWGPPGGQMDHDERIEQTCIREAWEETGFRVKIKKLVGIYSDPQRDPRGRVVSVAFACGITGGEMKLTRETTDIRWFSKADVRKMKLTFDHKKMIKDAGFI